MSNHSGSDISILRIGRSLGKKLKRYEMSATTSPPRAFSMVPGTRLRIQGVIKIHTSLQVSNSREWSRRAAMPSSQD